MRVIIERGKHRYEAVECGKRCSFGKPYIGDWGKVEYCCAGCNLPKWWLFGTNNGKGWAIMYGHDSMGLREIKEVAQ